jgi:hypothetical protein
MFVFIRFPSILYNTIRFGVYDSQSFFICKNTIFKHFLLAIVVYFILYLIHTTDGDSVLTLKGRWTYVQGFCYRCLL